MRWAVLFQSICEIREIGEQPNCRFQVQARRREALLVGLPRRQYDARTPRSSAAGAEHRQTIAQRMSAGFGLTGVPSPGRGDRKQNSQPRTHVLHFQGTEAAPGLRTPRPARFNQRQPSRAQSVRNQSWSLTLTCPSTRQTRSNRRTGVRTSPARHRRRPCSSPNGTRTSPRETSLGSTSTRWESRVCSAPRPPSWWKSLPRSNVDRPPEGTAQASDEIRAARPQARMAVLLGALVRHQMASGYGAGDCGGGITGLTARCSARQSSRPGG